MKHRSSARALLAGLLAALAATTAPTALAQTAAASAATQSAPASPSDPAQLIGFLNRTIGWYRLLGAEQGAATEPADQITVSDNRQIAEQAVRLAFEFARAQADAYGKGPGAVSGSGASSAQDQALRQMADRLEKQYQDTQAEMEADTRKLAGATGPQRQKLEALVAELQSELRLAGARRDAVHGMVEFVAGAGVNGVGTTGLRAQIEALASSVPAAALNAPGGAAASAGAAPRPTVNPTPAIQSDVSGIWGLSAEIFGVVGRIRTITAIIDETNALSKAGRDLRAPFVARLRDLSKRGDTLATQADTAGAAQLGQEKQQLDALAAEFKQVSSAVIPLSKQSVLLNVYERNLTAWRDTLESRYQGDLKDLGVRLAFLLVVIALVVGAAALWRRGVFRYVHDARRRYQLLLLRKVVLAAVIALIIALTLAGRLGSVVTFAGLLTAGVAVALQNVILSIVGYFFLIGKFGIRVGDRVQIESVTGEVIDIGLVRLHLMELGSGGFDAPTGRVVAFSNSIVFQPGAGLFKQIPGTSFVWHEVALTLPRSADPERVKDALLRAVTDVLSDYRADLDRQHREMERTVVSVSPDALQPKIRLRTGTSNIEVVVRFPVDLRRGAEIDERVSQAVLKAVEGEPGLNAASQAAPEVHLRTPDATGS